jgi:hypothetical protein
MKSELVIPANSNEEIESVLGTCDAILVGEFYVQRAGKYLFLKACQKTAAGKSLALFLEKYQLPINCNQYGEYELQILFDGFSCGQSEIDSVLVGRFGVSITNDDRIYLVAELDTEAHVSLLNLKRQLGKAHTRRPEQHDFNYAELCLGKF